MGDVLSRLRSALSGRYTREQELGRGGMATVWLAEEHHPARREPETRQRAGPSCAAAHAPDAHVGHPAVRVTLLLHIVAGGVVLVAAYAARAAAKGGQLHRRSGLVFVVAMTTMLWRVRVRRSLGGVVGLRAPEAAA